jgi:hypothetical protein
MTYRDANANDLTDFADLEAASHAECHLVLKVHGRAPRLGRYTLIVCHGDRRLLRRELPVR